MLVCKSDEFERNLLNDLFLFFCNLRFITILFFIDFSSHIAHFYAKNLILPYSTGVVLSISKQTCFITNIAPLSTPPTPPPLHHPHPIPPPPMTSSYPIHHNTWPVYIFSPLAHFPPSCLLPAQECTDIDIVFLSRPK